MCTPNMQCTVSRQSDLLEIFGTYPGFLLLLYQQLMPLLLSLLLKDLQLPFIRILVADGLLLTPEL